jgi:hypothetical protein
MPGTFSITEVSRNTGLPDFLCTKYQNGENVPNDHKIYTPNGHNIFPMAVKRPNGLKIYRHFPLQGPSKFTQIGILGLKKNHLASLVTMVNESLSGLNASF